MKLSVVLAKHIYKFLLLLLLLFPVGAFSQDDHYSLELDYSGGIIQRFPNGLWISADRTWNLEFYSDSVFLEGIGYQISEKDTLLRHYLTKMEFIMRNNTFLYTCPFCNWRERNYNYICLDGTTMEGKIICGQESQVFNIRTCYYEYNELHQELYDTFFNIAFYLLTETPVNQKSDKITFWQMTEFEQGSSVAKLPYRKVSPIPLKYRFYSNNYRGTWDSVIMTITDPDTPMIFEIADSFTISFLSGNHHLQDYLKDKSNIVWHVYNTETKKDLLELGIRKDCIKLVDYPVMGSNAIPKEARIDQTYEDGTFKLTGRSANEE